MDSLDHVVIVVPRLAEAEVLFRSASFTVTPGGRHDAVPTENALIGLADGSYLELLAARDPAAREEWRARSGTSAWERHLKGVSAIARRFLPTMAGPDGVGDWALCTAALLARAADLRRAGHAAAGPVPMSRVRRGGERLAWELLLPESRRLPFWIADRSSRDRRVPGSAQATTHANGASGVAVVRIRAENVPTTALELGDLLGALPSVTPNGATRLEMNGWRIEVTPGAPEGLHAVSLAGVASLPEDIRALGVWPEAD